MVVRFAPIVDSVQMIAALTLVIFQAGCLHRFEPGQLVQRVVKIRVSFRGFAFIASRYRWATPGIEAQATSPSNPLNTSPLLSGNETFSKRR
jgi:hypothetical protein